MPNALFACVRAVALVLATLALPAATAGSFQVSPIRVDLGPASASQALTVRNDGSETLVVQLSLQAWTQENGQDAFQPTQDALVTPPLATIPPGGEQVVRVGLRRAPDAARQGTYRLFVQEIPGPPPPGGGSTLQMALRVSLPVFVAPLAPARRDVRWSLARTNDGSVALTVENRGNIHVQLLDLALHAPDRDDAVARQANVAYVLAGQRRTFSLPVDGPLAAEVASLRLAAHTDAGPTDVLLPLAR